MDDNTEQFKETLPKSGLASDDKVVLDDHSSEKCEPTFQTAEQAWFWFTDQNDLNRSSDSIGKIVDSRPEFFRCVDRLYRHRRLTRDHLNVLASYGRRQRAPQVSRRREQRAHTLWHEALDRLDPVLRRSGFVRRRQPPDSQ